MSRRAKPVLIWVSCMVLAVAGALVVVRIARPATENTDAQVAPSAAGDGSSVRLVDDTPSAGYLMPGEPSGAKQPESCAQIRTLRRELGGFQTEAAEMKLMVQASPTATLEVLDAAVERLDDPAPTSTHMMFCNEMVPDSWQRQAPDPSREDRGWDGAITTELGAAGKPATTELKQPILLAEGQKKLIQLNVNPGDRPYAWRLKLTVQSGTEHREIVLDDNGKPFGTAPIMSNEAHAADLAGEGWSDLAGQPNAFTVPGGPTKYFPDLHLATYAGFANGSGPDERVRGRQVAWRRVVSGDVGTPPKGLTCAQLQQWLQSADPVGVGSESVVIGMSNTADVNDGAVIEDVTVRELGHREMPRSSQTVVECLQPGKQVSSALGNRRVVVRTSAHGEYPTSWADGIDGDHLLVGRPKLSFGNTVFTVIAPTDRAWRTFVVDLDVRWGSVRRRITMDNGGKPFETGSDLGGASMRTLAYCADKPDLGWTDAVKGNACRSAAEDFSAEWQFLVGQWGNTYRALYVDPDGTGEVRLSSPDGKRSAQLDIELEPGPTAQVAWSDDPGVPVGSKITIKKTADPGVIKITVPDKKWGTATLCNPEKTKDSSACQ